MKYRNKSFNVGMPTTVAQKDWDRIFSNASTKKNTKYLTSDDIRRAIKYLELKSISFTEYLRDNHKNPVKGVVRRRRN